MSGWEPLVRVSDVKTRLECDMFASCRQFHLHLNINLVQSEFKTHTHKYEHTHTAFSSVPEWSLRVFCLASGDDSRDGGGCSGKALFRSGGSPWDGRNKEL